MFFNFFQKKPFQSGYLPSLDGHEIFYQQFGNPKGEPVLYFHGGPGGSSKPTQTDPYDLKRFRVILFDQRGSGKSIFQNPVYKNTTLDTIQDAARLLNFLKIKTKIIVAGGSWGATLALLFAESYPKTIKKIVVSQIFLARERDRKWCDCDAVRFYPDIMDALQKPAGKKEIVSYYHQMIFSNSKEDQEKALALYGQAEELIGQISPSFKPAYWDEKAVRKLRVFLHYEKNHHFMQDNCVLNNIEKIRTIPMLIFHNRMDFCCPLEQAWEVHKHCPKSKLIIVPDTGHFSPKLFKTMKKVLKKAL